MRNGCLASASDAMCARCSHPFFARGKTSDLTYCGTGQYIHKKGGKATLWVKFGWFETPPFMQYYVVVMNCFHHQHNIMVLSFVIEQII